MVQQLRKSADVAKVTGGVIPNGRDLLRRWRRGDLPVGIVICVGGSRFFREDKLLEYLERGGSKPRQFAERHTEADEAGR